MSVASAGPSGAVYESSLGVGRAGLAVGVIGVCVAVGLLVTHQAQDVGSVVAAVVVGLVSLVLVSFRVRVRVTGGQIAIRASVPAGARVVAAADVETVERVPRGPLSEIGVRRFGRDSWGYVTGSGEYARMILRRGGDVMVAVRNAEEFSLAVSAAQGAGSISEG